MSADALAELLIHEKVLACVDGLPRPVCGPDKQVIALIEVDQVRDRLQERILKKPVFTPVAFVHLTQVGRVLLIKPWNAAR